MRGTTACVCWPGIPIGSERVTDQTLLEAKQEQWPRAASSLSLIGHRRAGEPAGAARAGGLESALTPALEAAGGGLWVGWSADAAATAASARRRQHGSIQVVSIGLTPTEIRGYYEGFSNQTLWPLLHGFSEKADLRAEYFEIYRQVNEHFADVVMDLSHPSDCIWVHDYHLMLLGAALRERGWDGPLGYFHHVSVPSPQLWAQIPHAATLSEALAAYDLIGVQTPLFAEHLRQVLRPEITERVAPYPISIDPEAWRNLARSYPGNPLAKTTVGRSVVLGVDRLDYSKGISVRFDAFERMLAKHSAWREHVVLVQWSAPSREAIPAYRTERAAVEDRLRQLNVRHGVNPPVAALEIATHRPSEVAAAYRESAVCLVTSFADGMNLVAKEFIAVQRPGAPGVLVLSTGCGAAAEMREALLVEPGDVSGIADAIERALCMSLTERQTRWQALSATLDRNTVHDWYRGYLHDLGERRQSAES